MFMALLALSVRSRPLSRTAGESANTVQLCKLRSLSGLRCLRNFGPAIAETMIALGKKLGRTVIAEGIESQATLHTLVNIGCDFGQGYFISKPIRSDDLVEWYCQAHYKHLFA
jgi:predicted signal transduction protein with EAL and GGDEF domain